MHWHCLRLILPISNYHSVYWDNKIGSVAWPVVCQLPLVPHIRNWWKMYMALINSWKVPKSIQHHAHKIISNMSNLVPEKWGCELCLALPQVVKDLPCMVHDHPQVCVYNHRHHHWELVQPTPTAQMCVHSCQEKSEHCQEASIKTIFGNVQNWGILK